MKESLNEITSIEVTQWIKKNQPIELFQIDILIPNRNIHFKTKVASHIEYAHAAGSIVHRTIL